MLLGKRTYIKKEAKKRPKAVSNLGAKVDTNQDHKIPFFKVPTFQGDNFQEDTYIDGVDRSFRSAYMARYY